ncbi:MAG TPA: rod shape-determining protein RodA [Bacillota bacterium]|nr:rod shape-determining protein RodA [Bacillota bacterium]
MWDRRFLRNLDFTLLWTVVGLIVIGLVMVFSATRFLGGDPYAFVEKQLVAVIIGLVGMTMIFFMDYRLSNMAFYTLYGINILMLAAVLVLGSKANGATSWINLGFMRFQPSEFSKLIMILLLSKHLSDKSSLSSIWDLLSPFFLLLVPLLLILLQPDFGTALVFVFFFFAMLYMAGAKGWHLSLIIFSGIFLITAVFVIHHFVPSSPMPFKDYQIKRLTSFMNPDEDPQGSGYNVRQAVIAVGSGRFFGKGLFHSTQGRLGFLPERHTDFIYAVFCEEWGFLGGFAMLILFLIFTWRGLKISQQAKERYGSLIAIGIMAMFLFHVLENAGMNMGIMPITGIPLPFISSGGSSMMANLFAVGFLENIWARRQKILF